MAGPPSDLRLPILVINSYCCYMLHLFIFLFHDFQFYATGVWFMHCHFDRHLVWGMETVFIVQDGTEARLSPPPPDMPPC
jgi:hypothetical protein